MSRYDLGMRGDVNLAQDVAYTGGGSCIYIAVIDSWLEHNPNPTETDNGLDSESEVVDSYTGVGVGV